MSNTAEKKKRLHRDDYYMLCAEELRKRDGLKKLPGDGPFWGECYRMTEEVYGCEGPGGNCLPAKENEIAANPALTHSDKVHQIDAIRDAREQKERRRREKTEAAKSPEQRAQEQRNGEAIDRLIENCMALSGDDLLDYLNSPSPNSAEPKIVEVIEREFNEHITEEDRIRANGWGISLDS
jgi:hypothetical protein